MKQQQYADSDSETTTTTITTTTMPHILMCLKLSFIYSAVADGWSVKMLSENKWCFTKKNVKKHYSVQTFLRKHMNQFKF